jgi:hypothetical protein
MNRFRRVLVRWDKKVRNYLVGSFAFGSLTHDQVLHSLDLFVSKVMQEPVPCLGRGQETPRRNVFVWTW